ncbi:MAG TPA: phosphoribosylanthranilate isomerase [Pyrinomonadaceae bacterium]|jgi:phosphoribosylanthranilate isomerase|nr:phosphoribosylanthranilate isomerase [Pyrinomonadaceae bacterium]
MVKIKVCGITNLEDALVAVDAGADALGFNFYRLSARFITPADARRIIERLPETVLSVGIFVNEERPETLARMADEAAVGAVQLHGDESPEYCRALGDRFVIKALRVGEGFRPESASAYQTEAILLDALDRDARGGTGRTIDWRVARKVRALIPKLFLAGGLSPDNIEEALAAVEPYGVDACSGLECAPGRKDAARVRDFIWRARRVKP